jgi:ABC-type branched-subunit amino acid transport system permease subunit
LNTKSLGVLPAPVTLSEAPTRKLSGRRVASLLGSWWQLLAVLALVIVGPSVLATSPYLNLLTLAGIWGIALVGVSMLAGLGGQFTFGQAGLVSIGAYSSAIVTVDHAGPPVLGVLVGIVVASAVALATAPILRLRGWYLALATLAIGFLFQEFAVNKRSLTGGNDGILGIQPFEIFGIRVEETSAYFVVCWSLVLVLMLVARNLGCSRFGSAARAIQGDEDAARSLGIPALRYKVTVWVLAAVMASISGSMYAHYARFISPQDFGFHQSIVLFMALLLGGYRSTFGALVALVFLVCLPELGRDVAPTNLITAIALMTVYTMSPDGLAGLCKAATGSALAATRRSMGRSHA